MKAVVLTDRFYDYDYCEFSVEGVILVPDDTDVGKLYQKWHNECAIPYKGKNQYGEWTSTKYSNSFTKSFQTWLSEKFETIEVIEYEV